MSGAAPVFAAEGGSGTGTVVDRGVGETVAVAVGATMVGVGDRVGDGDGVGDGETVAVGGDGGPGNDATVDVGTADGVAVGATVDVAVAVGSLVAVGGGDVAVAVAGTAVAVLIERPGGRTMRVAVAVGG